MHGSTARSPSSSPPASAEAPAHAPDLRDTLFAPLAGRLYDAEMTACAAGVLAGGPRLSERAAEIELPLEWLAPEGECVAPGDRVCRVRGDAWQIARAEELLVGCVAKPSGVATAAAALVAIAGGRARVVCGAWKKVLPETRPELRAAIAAGGAATRILDRPFVYLDKNHVRMLGGVGQAVRRARLVEGRAVVVQLRGETAPIADEAALAARESADVVMVDTGDVADLAAVVERLGRGRVVVAFGGGVTAATLERVVAAGAQAIDVGRAIIDAPLLDFRFDVVTRVGPWS
jgi:nicotinate-nucleotide pyrophosphorylase (carboxylating)